MKKANEKNAKETKANTNKNTNAKACVGKVLTAEELKALKNLKTPR